MKPTRVLPTNKPVDIDTLDPEITERLYTVLSKFDPDNPDLTVIELSREAENLHDLCRIPESPLAQNRFKQILVAISKGYINSVQIAEVIGTNRQTVTTYLNQYPLLAMTLNDVVMSKVDKVEERTFDQAINEPKASAERMFLLRNHRPDKYLMDRRANLNIRGNVNNIQINIGTTKISESARNDSRQIQEITAEPTD